MVAEPETVDTKAYVYKQDQKEEKNQEPGNLISRINFRNHICEGNLH